MKRIFTFLLVGFVLFIGSLIGIVYQLKPVLDAAGVCVNSLALAVQGSGVQLRQPSRLVLSSSQMAVAQELANAVIGHDLTTVQRTQALRVILSIGAVEGSFREDPAKNDRDSKGPLAQRVSLYGPFTSIDHAVDMALNGTKSPSNGGSVQGLFDVPEWDTRPPGEVAADLQRPAEQYRDRYTTWIPIVDEMLQGAAIDPTQQVVDNSCYQIVSGGVVDIVEAVIQRAMQQIGKPYVYGAQSPSVGFDCSGLVIDGLTKGAGLSVPDMTAAGLYDWATPIEPATAKRGDLLFRTLGHVVIYLGNDQALEAKQSGMPIGVYPVNWAKITQAARFPSSLASMPTAQTAFTTWGPPLSGQLRASSPYGMRFHPISKVWKLHNGLDLAAPEGTPIFAMRDAVVVEAGSLSGYGNNVKLDYGGGIMSRSAHMTRIGTGIRVGVAVRKGDVIGYVGSTGSSTGNHLHITWEVDGDYVDPAAELSKMGFRPVGRYMNTG
jgi:cell wall-associated NlpC family hydrolase